MTLEEYMQMNPEAKASIQKHVDFLIEKIRECNGSVRRAAEKLGMLRTALYNRLNHLGVNVKDI